LVKAVTKGIRPVTTKVHTLSVCVCHVPPIYQPTCAHE